MKETLIGAVLDWATQKADFERDGSLRSDPEWRKAQQLAAAALEELKRAPSVR